MNAERLLALYDRVADAPDAVPGLRSFVLDLAVRGQLVGQNTWDEPASEVLARIEAEKARLAESGEIKPRKLRSRPRQQPLEFVKPIGWELSSLGSVALKITDGTHKTPAYIDQGVPFVSVKDFSTGRLDLGNTRFISQTEHDALYRRCDPRRGDILIGRIGTLGKAVIVETDVEFSLFVSVGLIRIDHANVDPIFFRTVLNSPLVETEFNRIKIGGGTHTNKLNLGDLHTVAFPLPPFAEQLRIVAKVDELMRVCDKFEEARNAREDIRDLLTQANYARLNTCDVDDVAFRSHARCAINALRAMTARVDQVKRLRQAVLDLAVRGKLVEQDPADEPPPRYDLAIPCDLEPPFPIPPTWRWSRLCALGAIRGGGTPSKTRDDFWNGSIPWVSPKDMKVDYIAETQLNITVEAITGSAVSLIETESILFVVRGMILAHSFPVAISRVSLTINQDMKSITLKNREMAEYLLRALKGLKLQVLRRVKRSSHGTCRIESRDYRNLMIPVPPLPEQHRIVAKIDELMTLCDRLEDSLGAVEEGRNRFLESLLREALEPCLHEMEAAQ